MKIPSHRAPYRSFMTRWIGAGTFVVACAALSPLARADISFAPAGAALTIGDGNNVTVYGAAIHWDSLCSCAALKEYGFDTRLVAQVAYWRGRERPAARHPLRDGRWRPMPRWPAPPIGFSSFGSSASIASVVSIRRATDEAFCKANRATLVGSTTPIWTRSPYSPVWALKPKFPFFSAILLTTTEGSSPELFTI